MAKRAEDSKEADDGAIEAGGLTDAEATTATGRRRRAAKANTEAQTSETPARARARQGKAAQAPEPKVVEIRPMAKPATMKKRHWGVLASLFLVTILPILATTFYLYVMARDQFASTVAFSVRQEDTTSPAELVGGIARMMGAAGGSADTDILYEYIQSQEIVARIDSRLDLRGHYSAYHAQDPIFAFEAGGTIEDLLAYWKRMVRISYDEGTGLINLTVLAFEPEMARTIADAIIDESLALVNDLNATARADTLRYAEEDLALSIDRLKAAREAIVAFRIRTQMVDPQSDLEGRMGVINTLQSQLADAMVEYDLLIQTAALDDPRVVQAQRRIDVIRERLEEERRNFAQEETMGEAYPEIMAEYEGLVVDREFAELTYQSALANLDGARAAADRNTRYLATYIRPTLSERSQFPQRLMIISLVSVFLFLLWSILAMGYYALRDRK